MRIFLTAWRWRFVSWVTAVLFLVLFVYAIAQFYSALVGGGA